MRQNLYAELRVLSCLSTGTSRIVYASISITNNSQTSNELNVWAKINSPAKNKTEIMKNWRSICLFKSVPHLSHFRGVQRLISHTLNGDIWLSHFGHCIRPHPFLVKVLRTTLKYISLSTIILFVRLRQEIPLALCGAGRLWAIKSGTLISQL